jgi:hypothetical protein
MAFRFSDFKKSIKGSLVNSETWIFASAVAMAVFLLDRQAAIVLRRLNWLQGAVEMCNPFFVTRKESVSASRG